MTSGAGRSTPPLRPGLIAIVRFANAAFFLVTATYCVLTYNSFAYQQFIRPHLVASLSSFVVWHHLWHWVMLGLTSLTLVPELRSRSSGRFIAWTYLAAMTIVGVMLLIRPILPAVENDALGLWLAVAFLVPPIWLAAFDHVATANNAAPAPGDGGRILWSAITAAIVVWIINAVVVPLRFKDLGDVTMSSSGLAFGALTSLIVHVGMFGLLGFVVATALGAAVRLKADSIGGLQYWLLFAFSAIGCWLIAARLVFGSLSFRGPSAWLLALELALVLAGSWSGVARRIAAADPEPRSVVDVWFGPLAVTGSRLLSIVALVALPVIAFLMIERVSTFDWDFLVQNLVVIAVWLIASASVHALIRERPRRVTAHPSSVMAAAVMVVVLVGARGSIASELSVGLTRPAFVPEFVLDGYAVVDPSYRLLRHFLWVDPPGSAAFYTYLRANSLIQHVDIAPIDVDFVKPLPKAETRPPNVFLFVIDSLRRDYVSVYNPAVTFTPSFARFAKEGYAFERSFTRYGGTGLSMPAIWAGGMLVHKEYVLPFQRMNALEKLLQTNGYRSVISMDHITEQLLDKRDPIVELDHGRDEMQYDFCVTLDELKSKLRALESNPAPLFAHTRSLNLHVSKLTNRSVSIDQHDGFQGPAAAAVGRMDRCFGGFIDFLKNNGFYDDSVIIVTSDHGDSLGEAKRWGHSYTLFPEIVRTPLLIHVPNRLREKYRTDVDAVSFSTDLTPTLYALLGYSPAALGWAYGQPLFVPEGTDTSWRKRDTFLIASSYGPVYGLLRDNGQALYIADGLNLRDYAYDISGIHPVRVGVTDEIRVTSRELIRRQVGALGDLYHFTPQP